MLNIFQKIKTLINYKTSDNLGDFAILKSDFFGAKINPIVASKLQQVVGYHPPIDLEKLSQYPQNTFGRQYANHMRENNLKPLKISSELEDVAKRNTFALRYVVTHDIFHVLLGFDTSYAGEIGVLAFAAEQNYSKSLKISLWFAKLLYPILAPWQIKAIFGNLKKGQELGKKAEFLLGYRFEEHWEESIEEIRKRLKLPQISSISQPLSTVS
ncbi:Coq4 family protein [Chlorogloeopsis sp. ULAP01]|uniref:Coq4 family protein n=1 Tax=Chlorogloeopsis sp. ULAP01 TaxID=3056483 RepID=UPI0025AA681E|nr:Coq4 family protein [Chlorogloeopsis sp. ULAP01]MDM9383390.1 Coq4 family protein [Chlorogloeopsis sp. ULAP01]